MRDGNSTIPDGPADVSQADQGAGIVGEPGAVQVIVGTDATRIVLSGEVDADLGPELQEATAGKFRLGLGTQVRTHVVRRYGMAFDHPGPRLRDYLLAVQACFAAFRTGTLDHHGEFYDLDFITPPWSPGPIDAPDPTVDIAAVNPWMLAHGGRSRRRSTCPSARRARLSRPSRHAEHRRGSGEVGALTV